MANDKFKKFKERDPEPQPNNKPDNLLFELVIGKKDGTIDNASIPVRWCLTNELLEYVTTHEYNLPKVLIQVNYMKQDRSDRDPYCVRTEQLLVPLNQCITYVPLSRPGKVTINAFIVGSKSRQAAQAYHNAFLVKGYGSYEFTNLRIKNKISVPVEDLSVPVDIDIISKSLDNNLTIPEDVFGKKPPEWLFKLLNRYQNKDLDDECSLRGRYMMFVLKLPVIMVELIIRFAFILMLWMCAWLVGFVNIPTIGLKSPLNHWIGWLRYSSITHVTLTTKFDNVWDLFYYMYRIPLLCGTIIGASYVAVAHHSAITNLFVVSLIAVLFPAIIVTIVLTFVAICFGLGAAWHKFEQIKIFKFFDKHIFEPCNNWLDRVIFDPIEAFLNTLDERAAKRNNDRLIRLQKYLTCDNKPNEVTAEASSIPLKDQSIKLIYSNFKNKVCKPLAR